MTFLPFLCPANLMTKRAIASSLDAYKRNIGTSRNVNEQLSCQIGTARGSGGTQLSVTGDVTETEKLRCRRNDLLPSLVNKGYIFLHPEDSAVVRNQLDLELLFVYTDGARFE